MPLLPYSLRVEKRPLPPAVWVVQGNGRRQRASIGLLSIWIVFIILPILFKVYSQKNASQEYLEKIYGNRMGIEWE